MRTGDRERHRKTAASAPAVKNPCLATPPANRFQRPKDELANPVLPTRRSMRDVRTRPDVRACAAHVSDTNPHIRRRRAAAWTVPPTGGGPQPASGAANNPNSRSTAARNCSAASSCSSASRSDTRLTAPASTAARVPAEPAK